MKTKYFLAFFVLFMQGAFAQDSLRNHFAVFLEYPGYSLDRLGLKYCITNSDIAIVQFSIRTSLFNNDEAVSSYQPEQSNGYKILLGYKNNIYTYKRLNLSWQAAVERDWDRSTHKEAVYEYDQLAQKSKLVRYVGTEEKLTIYEIKLGMGAEYFIDNQFSLEILNRIHYGYQTDYRTDKSWSSIVETRRSFSVDALYFVVTFYF